MQMFLPFEQEKEDIQIHILDASAGSGKTYNLAKRYMQLLFLQKNQPCKDTIKNILAITFTNKATFEMKQRILEFLKRIALDKLSKEEKEEILGLDNKIYTNDKQIKELAKNFLEYILQNYDDFRISTIDSFLNLIISAYSLQLGISSAFKIEPDYYEYLKYSLDLLIDNSVVNKTLKKKFDKFIKNYLIWERNKKWFPKSYILYILKALYDESRIFGEDFVVDRTDYSKKLFNLCSETVKLVHELYNKLLPIEEYINKKFLNGLKKFIEKYEKNPLSITTGEISDYFEKNILTNRNYKVDKSLDELWEKIKQKLSDIFSIFDYSFFNNYITIFKDVEKQLNKETTKQDVVFLKDLNKKLYDVVSSNKYFVPELYMRLATNIKHCLIDEFQDTNVLQWRSLLPILEDILANGGTFFYVGDKKQAIYRFRGGDYKLFDDVYLKYFANYKYEKKTLSVNRRSQKVIVEFVNKVFSKENLKNFVISIKAQQDVAEEVLSVYSDSKQEILKEKLAGYVYGELINAENSEELKLLLKQKIIALIEKIRKKDKTKSIAILVRKQKDAEEISEWLLEKGFSVESEKTLNIQENCFVKELISLLKFLTSPFDNLSFASFITGDIFLESSKIKLEDINKFLLEHSDGKSLLYQKFQCEYKDIWEKFFVPIFEDFGFLPVYDLLIKIYFVFNFENNEKFKQNYAFYYHLLELAKLFEERDCSVRYFLEKFENLKEEEKNIVAKGENTIQILTIHKAKGLEFDIVILPYFSIDVDVGKKDTSISGLKWVTVKLEDGLRLVRIQKEHHNFSKELRDLYEEEYKKTLVDELNVLYVAMTRAKEHLYFFVPQTKRKSNNARFLVGLDKNEIIEIGEDIFSKNENFLEKEISTMFLEPIKQKEWYKKIVEPVIEVQEIKNREKIKEGEVVHKILSFIGNLYMKDIKKEVKKAVEKVKPFFPYLNKISLNSYKNFIFDILNRKELRDLFFVKDGIVYCEKEIVSHNGDVKRVDRLIIWDLKVAVVDYKLSYSQKNLDLYVSQVEEYKKILKEIYNDKEIVGYILFLDKIEFKII